jgi:hypothetical protein
MNIYLDVQSPVVREAAKSASSFGLANHGLVDLRVFRQLGYDCAHLCQHVE